MLEDAGLIEQKEGRYELTPAGIRKIGRNALDDIFEKLAKDKMGQHEVERTGSGHERSYETKAYEFGDPFNLNIERTVRNALARQGAGTPVRLTPDDFEVERTEHLTRSSTVLMVDLVSMPMRDNFLAAKKVAMALHSLISTQFPRDYLGIVGFSKIAHEIKPDHLPEVSWDFDYGTNMQHGILLARNLLARQPGTKQIIMITDGEPTAHITESGHPVFNYPPTQETVDATLTEVMRATGDTSAPPRTAVTIRSTGLHSMRAHPGRDRAQIHPPVAHRSRSQRRPRRAPGRQSPFPRAQSPSAMKYWSENKSPRQLPGEAPPLPVGQPGVPLKTSMRLTGRSSWMSRRGRHNGSTWSAWRFLASGSKRHHRSSWPVGDPRGGVKHLL